MEYQRIHVWIIEFILFLLHLEITECQARFYATKTATKCFAISGDSQLQFPPCKPGHMILIQEAFQGKGQDPGQCEYHYGDCISPLLPETEARLYRCIGAEFCEIPVRVGWIQSCQAYSTYVTVIYKCIAQEDILDICHQQKREVFRTGYITSHKYPSDYHPNLECQCNITTQTDQKMLITFSDFAVEWSENCLNDVLEIRDGLFEFARCGRLPRNHNVTSRTSRIEVAFKTDNIQEHKGFWLQIEALGSMEISCGPKDGSIQTQLPESSTTEEPETTATSSSTMPTTTIQTTLISIEGPLQTKLPKNSLQPTGIIPIFGSTNYEITYYDMNDKKTKDKKTKDNKSLENSIIKPTVSEAMKGDGKDSFYTMDEQLDLLLTNDILGTRVTNNNYAGNLGGQLKGLETSEDVTTYGPDNQQVKPRLVVSPLVGIVIGCVLLFLLILVLVCVIVWRKRHRKKKCITAANKTNEPKLTKHSYPHINSPRPSSTHSNTTTQSQGPGLGGHAQYGEASSPRQHQQQYSRGPLHYPHSPDLSQFADTGSPVVHHGYHHQGSAPAHMQHFPESPVISCRSFGSDNSFESGRSGPGVLKRGDRVKKHYKRCRMSPRLESAHFPSREELEDISMENDP